MGTFGWWEGFQNECGETNHSDSDPVGKREWLQQCLGQLKKNLFPSLVSPKLITKWSICQKKNPSPHNQLGKFNFPSN